MIVGNGMLAQAFSQYSDNDDVIIFASGVSHSRETQASEFERELKLIQETIMGNSSKLFVYFSTCSMYDQEAKETPYVQHKLEMERYVKENANTFIILRVSQVIGKSKNKTLINYLHNCIINNEKFEVWKNSNRNLITLEDVVSLTEELVQNTIYHNTTYHIANQHYISVVELVSLIESLSGRQANYSMIDKGEKYMIIPNDIDELSRKVGIEFDSNYYQKKIETFLKGLDD